MSLLRNMTILFLFEEIKSRPTLSQTQVINKPLQLILALDSYGI